MKDRDGSRAVMEQDLTIGVVAQYSHTSGFKRPWLKMVEIGRALRTIQLPCGVREGLVDVNDILERECVGCLPDSVAGL